jgi:hypothetical protein
MIGFDEFAHISYVAHMQAHPAVSVNLEDLLMLDPVTFMPTTMPNYLNHPVPYYKALAAIGPTVEGNPHSLLTFRLMNVFVVVLGLAVLFAIGLKARLPRFEFLAYMVPLTLVPILPQLAGAVTNDNLAFVGGALAMFGAFNLVSTDRPGWFAAALAGVVLAGWAKFTGLILTGGLVGSIFFYLLVRGRTPLWSLPALAVTFAVAALPYVGFLLQYHSPTPNSTGQLALLNNQVPLLPLGHESPVHYAFPVYVARFVGKFVSGWAPTAIPRGPFAYAMLFVPAGTLLCAIAGITAAGRRVLELRESALDVVVLAAAFAFAATFAAHIGFSYQRNVDFGWLLDAHPRYYFPVVALVPLACLALLSEMKAGSSRTGLLTFLIVGPIAFRVYGV